MCDHCSKVTSQKGYSGQVTCKCDHGEKKDGEKDKDFGGCCSKKTYKPLLEQGPAVPYYPPTGPGASLHGGPVPFPVAPPPDTGCCSWARDCCGGGCCAGTRCCAPPEPMMPDLSQLQSPPLGYGYGPSLPSYNQPGTGFPSPSSMNAGYTREDDARVPCVSTKKEEPKLPKCFGGDCQGSEDCEADVVPTVQSA